MGGCAAFDPLGPYVPNLLGFVDCQTLALGQDGYAALGPGSAFGVALGGLLVICVALVGWRLMLGEGPGLRDGVLVALRLGIVLALASQWSAFQPLIYGVATNGPEDIATQILAPGGLGGQDKAGLAARVQAVSAALAVIAESKPASGAIGPQAVPPGNAAWVGPEGASTVFAPEEAALSHADRAAVASANRLLVGTTLGGMGAVRVVVGLMLALAPVFLACLLFDAARGLFAAWLRVLAGAALGAVAVPTVLALELAVIEPQVVALHAAVLNGAQVVALPGHIWMTALVFALGLTAALLGAVRAAAGFHFPQALRCGGITIAGQASLPCAPAPMGSAVSAASGNQPRSRAQQVADAAMATARRGDRGASDVARPVRVAVINRDGPDRPGALVPLGQARRRSQTRASLGANRRDKRI